MNRDTAERYVRATLGAVKVTGFTLAEIEEAVTAVLAEGELLRGEERQIAALIEKERAARADRMVVAALATFPKSSDSFLNNP